MTVPLLLIAGAALIALSLGFRAKEKRIREQEKSQPRLPFDNKTETKQEEPHYVSAAR